MLKQLQTSILRITTMVLICVITNVALAVSSSDTSYPIQLQNKTGEALTFLLATAPQNITRLMLNAPKVTVLNNQTINIATGYILHGSQQGDCYYDNSLLIGWGDQFFWKAHAKELTHNGSLEFAEISAEPTISGNPIYFCSLSFSFAPQRPLVITCV